MGEHRGCHVESREWPAGQYQGRGRRLPISRTWKKAIVWHSKLYRFSLIHWIFSLGVLCIELQPVRDGWAATPLYKGKREFFTLSLYHFITKFVLTTIIEHVTSVLAKMVTTLKICFANKERSLEGSLGNVRLLF